MGIRFKNASSGSCWDFVSEVQMGEGRCPVCGGWTNSNCTCEKDAEEFPFKRCFGPNRRKCMHYKECKETGNPLC